jgi:outer membrane autotransporter protein
VGSAQSDSEIDVFNGGLRAAYVLGSPQLYVKPMIDAAATRLDLGGTTETGGGAASLSVQGSNQTVYTIAPALEIGTEWWAANGTLVRPFLRGGATWYENGDLALTAAFLNAPAGVSQFTILTDIDEVMGVVGAGLDVIAGTDTVLHACYDGQFGETTQIHVIALKGSARF